VRHFAIPAAAARVRDEFETRGSPKTQVLILKLPATGKRFRIGARFKKYAPTQVKAGAATQSYSNRTFQERTSRRRPTPAPQNRKRRKSRSNRQIEPHRQNRVLTDLIPGAGYQTGRLSVTVTVTLKADTMNEL